MPNSLIIKTREYGFFSSLFQIIDNIRYCEINDIKPIIDVGEKYLYQNNNSNPWNYFFENINDNIIEGEKQEITELTNNANFLLDDYMLVCPTNGDYHLNLWHKVQTKNKDIELEYRNKINDIIKKYIKPIPDIQRQIDLFIQNNFEDSVLAVHIRGTDYGFHSIDSYIDKIKEIQQEKNYKKIFVASDNHEAIIKIKEAFNNVCFYETNLRAENINSVSPVCHIVSGDDKIKHGQDVLIECLLLSKCNEIICINSNVAGAACLFNPNMIINLLTRIHGGG
jgi:hypothetical protein